MTIRPIKRTLPDGRVVEALDYVLVDKGVNDWTIDVYFEIDGAIGCRRVVVNEPNPK